MLQTLFKTAALFFVLCVLVACQKSVAPDEPAVTDSIVSLLPTSITVRQLSENVSLKFNFLYDSANYRIQLYRDDPATVGLYDAIEVEYQFNTDGYLTSVAIADSEQQPRIIKIKRSANNNIEYITNLGLSYAENDTAYFAYGADQLGTRITESHSYYSYGGEYQGISKTDYVYAADGRLLSVSHSDGISSSLSYQGGVLRQCTELSGLQKINDGSLMYAQPDPADAEDKLLRLMIGKDHHIVQLMQLYIFLFPNDYNRDMVVSMTDPHQLAAVTETHYSEGEVYSSINGSLQRTFDDKGRLLSLQVNHSYSENEQLMLFTY